MRFLSKLVFSYIPKNNPIQKTNKDTVKPNQAPLLKVNAIETIPNKAETKENALDPKPFHRKKATIDKGIIGIK